MYTTMRFLFEVVIWTLSFYINKGRLSFPYIIFHKYGIRIQSVPGVNVHTHVISEKGLGEYWLSIENSFLPFPTILQINFSN